MPRIRTESIGGGDLSWAGSTQAIFEARTEVVNVSAFTAGTHYPNGYLPSGTAVAKVAGLLVPYDKTEATVTGAGVLAGHILFDQAVIGSENFIVPLYDHDRVTAALVPNSFVAPVAPAKAAATNIVYI